MIDPLSIPTWFFGFAQRHAQRCRRPGWPPLPENAMPPPETQHFFAAWLEEFTRHGVTEPIADLASIRLAATDYPWPNDPKHRIELMRLIHRAFEDERARSRGLESGSRESCEAQSRDCPECSGCGWATRLRRHPNIPDATGRVTLFCRCPMGEYLSRYYYENDRELWRRSRRLVQYPELWDRQLDSNLWSPMPEPRPWPIESWWVRSQGLGERLAVYAGDES